MVQTLKDTSLGERLGTGLGEGLRALAEQNFNQMQARKQAELARAQTESGLASLFEPEQARGLSSLQPDLLKSVVTEKLRGQRQLAQTGPGIKTIAPELSDEQSIKIGALPPGVQQLWYRNYLESPQQAVQALNEIPTPSWAKAVGIPTQQSIQEELPEGKIYKKSDLKTTQPKLSKEEILNSKISELSQKPSLMKQKTEIKKIEPSEVITPRQQTEFLREKAKEVLPEKVEYKNVSDLMREGKSKSEAHDLLKEQKQKRSEGRKESQKYYNEINAAATGAKDDIIRLDKIMELNEKGNLGFPILNSIIKGLGNISLFGTNLGIDLSGLMTADAQTLDKLSTDFVKNAKQYFGSRLTDADLKAYMKTVPTLLNSKEGRREVIRNMRIFLEAKLIRQKAMNEIIKANGNEKPENLNTLVDEASESLINNLAEQFRASPNFPQEEPNVIERVLKGVGLQY